MLGKIVGKNIWQKYLEKYGEKLWVNYGEVLRGEKYGEKYPKNIRKISEKYPKNMVRNFTGCCEVKNYLKNYAQVFDDLHTSHTQPTFLLHPPQI